MERGKRIELSASAWKAEVLPLYEPRINNNMKLHTEIDIPNVESIKEQALKIIGPEYFDAAKPIFAYLPDSIRVFLAIPELKSFLDSQGWTEHVTGIMLNIIPPGGVSTIHIDAPMFNKSFNIPLSGYEVSYVDFFKQIGEPTFKDKPDSEKSTKFKFWTFERKDVELIERYQTTGPYMLRTDIPHQVINNGTSKRAILLVRLSHKLDLSQYYI